MPINTGRTKLMEKLMQVQNIESQKKVYLEKSIQKLLNIFAFFVIYPALDLGGISITFYIFFILLYYTKKTYGYIFKLEQKSDFIPFLLGLVFLVSYIFAEPGYEKVTLFNDFKLLTQYLYWLLILFYFSTWADKINFFEFSKYVFYGLIAITLSQYFLYSLGFPRFTQNAYIFNIVTCGSLSFYYLYKRYNFLILAIVGGLFFASAILSQSRSGSVLVFLQITMVISLVSPSFKRFIFFVSILALPILIILVNEVSSIEGRNNIAALVEDYNPRMAELIQDPEQVTYRDKSWLTRQMMIRKGMDIHEQFPWFGVGLGRFNNYWIDIERINKWSNDTMEHYNQRSSHNSYIQLLAETGQLGLGLFVLLLIIILVSGLKYLVRLEITPAIFIMIGFIGMCIHMWAIASLTGTNTWFVLGLSIAVAKGKFSST